MNGHGAEIEIQRERERERAYYHSQGARCLFLYLQTLASLPRVQQERAELQLHQGQRNQTEYRREDRRGSTNYVMCPLCCSCPLLPLVLLCPLLSAAPPRICLSPLVHRDHISSDCCPLSLMETDTCISSVCLQLYKTFVAHTHLFLVKAVKKKLVVFLCLGKFKTNTCSHHVHYLTFQRDEQRVCLLSDIYWL